MSPRAPATRRERTRAGSCRIFVHPERANTPLLAPCLADAAIARADGVWVRDTGGHAVLTQVPAGRSERPQLATGLVLEVPELLLPALDLMWRGPAIARKSVHVTAALRKEAVVAWLIDDLRHARMYGYRVPKGVSDG